MAYSKLSATCYYYANEGIMVYQLSSANLTPCSLIDLLNRQIEYYKQRSLGEWQ